MRHTRNRQMTKIGEENFMGMKNFKISMIRKFDGKFPNRLDPTFKWDRKMGRVQWSFENGNTKTTMFALLKYPTALRWLDVKLKRKGE
ncbi:hypothetical protein COC69_12575 [Bacillus cereus]|uniref:Uncharacterized protein n=1 Tax=Bacillus cereus TaxID=1396 RepID=A0A9X7CNI3_BACCE|nr:hypothetical protein [Bacillus cereus]PGS79310.1 hypothetical protein COC69_12575 [Bacillus cereus]